MGYVPSSNLQVGFPGLDPPIGIPSEGIAQFQLRILLGQIGCPFRLLRDLLFLHHIRVGLRPPLP